MQWKHKTSRAPIKFRTQSSARKIMATVFWDCNGILLVEYMPHKSIVTADVYVNTMKSLREAIKEKRRGLLTRGVMLLHDNAPVHRSKKVQTAILECGFQEMNHPPYSPYLAPSDYFLFEHLKNGRSTCGDADFQVTHTFRRMFHRGWRAKIPTSTWPEYHHSQLSGTSA